MLATRATKSNSQCNYKEMKDDRIGLARIYVFSITKKERLSTKPECRYKNAHEHRNFTNGAINTNLHIRNTLPAAIHSAQFYPGFR